MKFSKFSSISTFIILLSLLLSSCRNTDTDTPWNKKYDFIYDTEPIVFHYDHGILAGSYIQDEETTEIRFNDVCKYLGHICLCGAGGYKISEKAVNALGGTKTPLERGDFILISSRDHTVSDVIAYVLGCSRRNDPEKNQYFIAPGMESFKREYHYYIAYVPEKKALHITYRKHLLIGNEKMDSFWKVELAYEEDPTSVEQSELELYQNTILSMVKDVLSDRKKGLIEVKLIDYEEFQLIQKKINN